MAIAINESANSSSSFVDPFDPPIAQHQPFIRPGSPTSIHKKPDPPDNAKRPYSRSKRRKIREGKRPEGQTQAVYESSSTTRWRKSWTRRRTVSSLFGKIPWKRGTGAAAVSDDSEDDDDEGDDDSPNMSVTTTPKSRRSTASDRRGRDVSGRSSLAVEDDAKGAENGFEDLGALDGEPTPTANNGNGPAKRERRHTISRLWDNLGSLPRRLSKPLPPAPELVGMPRSSAPTHDDDQCDPLSGGACAAETAGAGASELEPQCFPTPPALEKILAQDGPSDWLQRLEEDRPGTRTVDPEVKEQAQKELKRMTVGWDRQRPRCFVTRPTSAPSLWAMLHAEHRNRNVPPLPWDTPDSEEDQTTGQVKRRIDSAKSFAEAIFSKRKRAESASVGGLKKGGCSPQVDLDLHP